MGADELSLGGSLALPLSHRGHVQVDGEVYTVHFSMEPKPDVETLLISRYLIARGKNATAVQQIRVLSAMKEDFLWSLC